MPQSESLIVPYYMNVLLVFFFSLSLEVQVVFVFDNLLLHDCMLLALHTRERILF